MSDIKELLRVTQDEVQAVRKLYNKTEEDIKLDLNILLDWLHKQPHLPGPHDENRLERCLLRNKFRIEQTKTKQDNFYTYKGLYPQLVMVMDPQCVEIQNVRKSFVIAPMPKLLPTLDRLFIFHFAENNEEFFNMYEIVRYLLAVVDLQMSYDYSVGDRYVLDCKYLTIKHCFKMDISTMHKTLLLHQKAFSGRFSAIDFVNIMPGFDIFLNIMTKMMDLTDRNISKKVKVHRNIASLQADVPKEYLPKELGGDQDSIHDVHDRWIEEIKVQYEFLKQNAKIVSNENLRVGNPIQNDLFGTDGTFRKMNLD